MADDRTSVPSTVMALLEDSAEDLYENAPCGYFSTLLDGTIVKVNETFLRWTGYERDELVAHRRFQDLLPTGAKVFHDTHFAPLLTMQGEVREIALDLVCRDGRRLAVLVNSVVRVDAFGAPVIVRTTVFDATDRRRYERELLRERQRAEESETRSRLFAQTLQQSFIPPALPLIPGLELAGVYRPAGTGDEVGGDFYDAFEARRDDWAVVVGDVCGKGPEAAVVTAIARYTLRGAAVHTRRPAQALATLNKALLSQGTDRFCTATYVRVRHVSGQIRLTVTSGGHPLPIHAGPTRSPVHVGRHGSLLGVLEQPSLRDVAVDLGPGEVFLLYTDGVTEARRGREFFGDQRLRDLVARCLDEPASAIAETVVAEVLDFQGGVARDDIAVVAVKRPV